MALDEGADVNLCMIVLIGCVLFWLAATDLVHCLVKSRCYYGLAVFAVLLSVYVYRNPTPGIAQFEQLFAVALVLTSVIAGAMCRKLHAEDQKGRV